MSSLGIFNKETKTYQKVAGTAEAAVLDTAMSDTSENPVQNKVIKKYVDSKQVEVPIAGTGKAGIVKPADGLTVEEDGTLKVNLDGTTLTMDQVNNVIKLADTLKDAINGAFPAANVANNQITTVEGFALDARQANPNIDGSLAKQISDLNGSLEKLNDFTDISSNDNLYDIKFFNVGKYRCSFNVVAATVLNSPFNTAFTMEAFQSAGTPQYIAQKAIEFEFGHCKWRVKDTGSGTIIQDWVQLY